MPCGPLLQKEVKWASQDWMGSLDLRIGAHMMSCLFWLLGHKLKYFYSTIFLKNYDVSRKTPMSP